MHKVFGTRLDARYCHRPGAYLIPIRESKIAVVQLPKGLFLLGGGMEPGEEDAACIRRECLEETGCAVSIRERIGSAENWTTHPRIGYFHPIQSYYLGDLLEQVQQPIEHNHTLLWLPYEQLRGRMFSPMQNWALERAWNWDK